MRATHVWSRAPDALAIRRSAGSCENRLFASLPEAIQARLRPHLQLVPLPQKQVLFRAHEVLQYVYFPCTAVVSLVSRLESGEMLAVGLVGRDGIAGTSILPEITAMSCDGVVQVPGLALQVRADVFGREVASDETLRSLIERFTQVLFVWSTQISLCNTFHAVEQRCIRWLLSVNDLIPGNVIPLTHELLATTLGVHRPTVTLAIRGLDRMGLVDERRGRLIIRNRDGLEAACCECYGVMRGEQQRLLGY